MVEARLTRAENMPDPIFRPGYVFGIFRKSDLNPESREMITMYVAHEGVVYALIETSGAVIEDGEIKNRVVAAAHSLMERNYKGKPLPEALTFTMPITRG